MKKRAWSCLGVILLGSCLAAPLHAQLAGRAAEEWIKTLDAPDRLNAMKIGELIAALKIKPGETVADVGAGSGVLSGPLAIATGSSGVLYAVDIDKDFLAHINTRAAAQKISNIRTVLGGFTDPKLPVQVDLAFMNDVLHHVADRAAFLKSLVSYLKPGGRLAIVDYIPFRSPHADQPELTVSEEEVDTWLQALGLKGLEKVPLFDDRYYVIYAKP